MNHAVWLLLAFLLLGVLYVAIFSPSRKLYAWLEKRGHTRSFIAYLILGAILLIPLTAVFVTISDRLRESAMAGVLAHVEPIVESLSRGTTGPLETDNPGAALISMLAGEEVQRAPNIQYRPIDFRLPGAQRLSSEENLPFFVMERELRPGEILRFPSEAGSGVDHIAVAVAGPADAQAPQLDVTIVGTGTSRRLLVIDGGAPQSHGWGEGSERVIIYKVAVDPPASPVAIELRAKKNVKIAGLCQIERDTGTALSSEEPTRSGLPVRAPATGSGHGIPLVWGQKAVELQLPDAVECNRLWLVYTSTDARAVDYRSFGEDIIELRLEYEGGHAPEIITLKHGEDVHSGNLERSRHADDLASAVAFTWEREGVRWHADQRKFEFDGNRRIKKLQFRNVSGFGGYPVELLGVTTGIRRTEPASLSELPKSVLFDGQKLKLNDAIRKELINYQFAVADRRGVIRLSRGADASRLTGVTLDDTDLAEILAGHTVAPRCGAIAGIEGDIALLPIRDRDTVVGSLLLFSSEGDRAFRRGKFAFIPVFIFIFISPLLIIVFAESIARGESIRRKIAIALAMGAIVPAATLFVILPGSFEGARSDAAARRLDAELKVLRERLARDRETAPAAAAEFFKSFREHPRVAPNFLPPARADLESQLKRELSIARKAAFRDTPSFVRLELRMGAGVADWKIIEDSDAPININSVDFQGSDYYQIQGSLFLVSVDRWSRAETRARLILGSQVAIGSDAGERARVFDMSGTPVDRKPLPEGVDGTVVREMIDNSSRGNRAVVRAGEPTMILDVFRDRDSNPVFGFSILESGGRGELLILGVRVPLSALLGGILLFAALGTLAIARILTERLTRPIELLASAADQARAGNITIPMDVGGSDELGELAERFHMLSRELVRRIDHLSELHKGMWSFAGRLDRADVAREASRFAANVTHAASAIIIIPDPHGTGWRCYYSSGKDRPAPLGLLLQRIIVADSWMLLQNEGPELLQFVHAAGDLLGGSFASVWSGPIRLGLRNEGYLLLAFSQATTLAQRESARAAAGAIAIALENARAYGLAIEDSTTRALVPHFFEMRMNESLDRARALSKQICFIRWSIVDARGQGQASEVVTKMAARIRRLLERMDHSVFGRMGPFELVVAVEDPGAQRRERILRLFRNVSDAICARHSIRSAEISHAIFPDQGPSFTALLRLVRRESAPEPPPEALVALAGGIEFQSEAMREVLARASRLIQVDIPILIHGEPDAGKEFLARQMHNCGARPEAPLVICTIGQIPASLVEAELFGAQAGAFSGVDETRLGYFEQANGGTLVLSEIQECPLDVQSKILRVIQERSVRRLGSQQPVPLHIRIIATASRDLSEMTRAGAFRSDLYYRIAGALLNLPPLRERKDDIPVLCRFMLDQESPQVQKTIAPAAMERLMNHAWPGNLSELKSVLMRALVLAGERNELSPEDIEITRLSVPALPRAAASAREATRENMAGAVRGSRLSPTTERRAGDVWNERQTRLLAMLAKGDRITTTDYIRLMNVSSRTGLRDLVELVRKGRLRQEGRKRGTSFKML